MKEILIATYFGLTSDLTYFSTNDFETLCNPFSGHMEIRGVTHYDTAQCFYTDAYGAPVYDLTLIYDLPPELMLDVYLIDDEYEKQAASWLPL